MGEALRAKKSPLEARGLEGAWSSGCSGSSSHGESVAREDDDENADEEELETMADRRTGGARLTVRALR